MAGEQTGKSSVCSWYTSKQPYILMRYCLVVRQKNGKCHILNDFDIISRLAVGEKTENYTMWCTDMT